MQLPFADGEIKDDTSGLRLVRPAAIYLESYHAACEETWNHIHNRYILHDPAVFESWQHTIFDTFEKRYLGLELPEGYYPSLMLWAIKGERFVGAVNIRLRQDAELISYGGTVGYFITHSLRGIGLGTSIAKLGVKAAQRLGLDPIVITCQESNAASMAVGEHLPYLIKERDVVDVDGIVQPIWRFWMTPKAEREALEVQR